VRPNLSTLATPHRVNVGLARVRGSDGAIDLSFSGDGMQQTSFGAGEAVPTAILLQPNDGRSWRLAYSRPSMRTALSRPRTCC